MVSDPGQHDGGGDRFVDVVDGPQRQAVRLRTLLHLGGQEDHRDLPRLRHLLQRLHHLIAIHLGHHHVEQDQVHPGAGREDLQRPLAADGDLDPVVGAEQGAEQGEVLRVSSTTSRVGLVSGSSKLSMMVASLLVEQIGSEARTCCRCARASAKRKRVMASCMAGAASPSRGASLA